MRQSRLVVLIVLLTCTFIASIIGQCARNAQGVELKQISQDAFQINGRVLNTTGDNILNEFANRFTQESASKKLPIYLVIVDKSLLNAEVWCGDVANEIVTGVGRNGTASNYKQDFRFGAWLPAEALVIAVCPFVTRADGEDLYNASGAELITTVGYARLADTSLTGQRDVFTVSYVNALNSAMENGNWQDAVIASLPQISSAVEHIYGGPPSTEVAKQVVSQNQVIATATNQFPESSELPQGKIGSAESGAQTLLRIFLFLLLIAVSALLYWWRMERRGAILAQSDASFRIGRWPQEMQEALTAIASNTDVLTAAQMSELRAKVSEADKMTQDPIEQYPILERTAGDPKAYWMLPQEFNEIEKRYQTRVVNPMSQALNLLQIAKQEINEARDNATLAPKRVQELAERMKAMWTTINGVLEKFPSSVVSEAGNAAFGLYQQAEMLISTKQFGQAFTLCEEAMTACGKAEDFADEWEIEADTLDEELNELSKKLIKEQLNLSTVQSTLQELQLSFAKPNWDDVDQNQGLIETALDEVANKLKEAETLLKAGKFEELNNTLDQVQAGFQQIDLLVAAVTNLAADLAEQKEKLPSQVSKAVLKITELCAYVSDNLQKIDEETESVVQLAAKKIADAEDELAKDQPDYTIASKLYREAIQLERATLQEAKDDVQKFSEASATAVEELDESARYLSQAVGYITSKSNSRKVSNAAESGLREAQERHELAASNFEAAETFTKINGKEAEILAKYQTAATLANEAEERAKSALKRAKEDVAEHEAPSATYTGGGYSSGGSSYRPSYTPTATVYRPSGWNGGGSSSSNTTTTVRSQVSRSFTPSAPSRSSVSSVSRPTTTVRSRVGRS